MARRSLGDRWEALSQADQGEFTRLFTNLIVASYMGKIELYAGGIRYLGERVDGAAAAVEFQIVTPIGSQVNVKYRLNRPQDRWTVYDSEPEAPAACRGPGLRVRRLDPHDHRLVLFQIAADDLRKEAIADADLDGHGTR